MARIKQTARKSTGHKCPSRTLPPNSNSDSDEANFDSSSESEPELSPNGMEYAKLTVAELKRFIKARTGKKSRPHTSKATCVRTLQQLDTEWRFPRFLEFPEEIRAMVYGQLLGWKAGTNKTTNILRTCSEVYHGAVDVLYAENELLLKIAYPRYGSSNSKSLNGKQLLGPFPQDPRLPNLVHLYRTFANSPLLRARILVIQVDVPSQVRPTATEKDLICQANHALYAACELLCRSSKLREVHVRCGYPHSRYRGSTLWTVESDIALRLLYPVTRLGVLDLDAIAFDYLCDSSSHALSNQMSDGTPSRRQESLVTAVETLAARREEVAALEIKWGKSTPLLKVWMLAYDGFMTRLGKKVFLDAERDIEVKDTIKSLRDVYGGLAGKIAELSVQEGCCGS